MKSTLVTLLVWLVPSVWAQTLPVSNYIYPTKMEELLHRADVVVNSTSAEVGTEEGKSYLVDTNLVFVLRTETITCAFEKQYGLTLHVGNARDWRFQLTYVDYDELNGLLSGIDRILELKPELPTVQARFQTRGGLVVGTYSTEKREVLAWIEIGGDSASRIQVSEDTLRDFRALIVTAKQNLDLLRAAK